MLRGAGTCGVGRPSRRPVVRGGRGGELAVPDASVFDLLIDVQWFAAGVALCLAAYSYRLWRGHGEKLPFWVALVTLVLTVNLLANYLAFEASGPWDRTLWMFVRAVALCGVALLS